jgi:hypothetical protein
MWTGALQQHQLSRSTIHLALAAGTLYKIFLHLQSNVWDTKLVLQEVSYSV